MNHIKYSTHQLDVSDRPEFWGKVTTRYFGTLRVQGMEDEVLNASLESYEVGAMRMIFINAPAHSVQRDAACGDLPTDQYYKLLLQLHGHASIVQGLRRFELQPGDWSLYDPRAPYAIDNHDRISQMVVQIPRSDLKGFKVPNLHTCEARNSGVAGLHSVFGSFLRSIYEQLPALPDGAGVALSEAVQGLLVSTLAEYRVHGTQSAPLPAVLKMRVLNHVNAHLADPDLSIENIADALNCSKRYLHRLFEGDKCSLERYIWNQRLEHCAQALGARQDGRRAVSEVAYAWGFNSNAHFCRLFKARYGVSPREYQSQQTNPSDGLKH